MTVQLNHIIIPAKDPGASAEFLASILGLSVGTSWGPFVPVQTANGVTLDYGEAVEFHPQHCAFLVSDAEFDAGLARLLDGAITIYADPFLQRPGQINQSDGGRGVYFKDPNSHLMEMITQPYGAAPAWRTPS